MQKIISFIKKYWILLFTVLAAVLYIAKLIIVPAQTKVSPSPTPSDQVASYKSIVPGVSTEADLKTLLGTPVKTTIDKNQSTDEFKSTSELRRHIATIQNGKVTFFKEIVSSNDKTTANDIINIYGSATDVLYSKLPNSVFKLYVYPQNGIAYIGASDGTLLEIWYFKPIDISNFISQWGQEYSTSPNTEVVQ